ncbi:MAG TPA: hypothetical protein VG935_03175 [Patescibacteria group bacterium]|nr:hypothetical protein [Patescibacteria group bacterium]
MIDLRPEKYGYLHLYADKYPINTGASREAAAAVADKYNSAKYLEQTFFTQNPTILNISEPSNGSKVTTMIPSGPYTPESVLVIAKGPDSFAKPQVETQFIYDFPFETQASYWRHAQTLLEEMGNIASEREDRDHLHVVATENSIVTRTSAEARTSRSIALPHFQAFILNEEHIEPFSPDEAEIPHLVEEQNLLQRYGLVDLFAAEVNRRVTNASRHELVGQQVRMEAPYGYAFVPSPTNDSRDITRAMFEHHQAYKSTAEKMLDRVLQISGQDVRQQLVPQPSYRLYMYRDNGLFSVLVSPEFRSYAGVLEAGGIELKRGPDFPHHITEEDREKFYRRVADAVNDEFGLPNLSSLEASEEEAYAAD